MCWFGFLNHMFFIFFHGKPLFYFQKRRLHQENLMKEKRELKKEKRRTIMKK